MAMALAVTRSRLQRLVDERNRTNEKMEDLLGVAEEEERSLGEFETEQIGKYREQVESLQVEIEQLTADLERAEKSQDVSRLIRVNEPEPQAPQNGNAGPAVYRTFAQFARDQLITRYPGIANAASGNGDVGRTVEQAKERLERTLQHTLSSDVAGLLPPQHMAQIMDIINGSRPVVSTARSVDLSSGKLTYPKIGTRPEVLKQGSEKTEAGTAKMTVTLEDMTADTYLGGGNLSWQTINWSTPNALQLWFDLAAEAYARATENAACDSLEAAAAGTVSPALGTAGTESLAQWRAASIGAISAIYTTTAGRARTNTLYLAADRFFQLAGLGDANVTNMTAIGGLNIDSMTGTFSGLRVVGSYGFTAGAAILGDSSAFLVGETPGAPVELRAVEPAIGGMEVGVIGAFQSLVFDTDRFLFLS